MVYLHPTRPMPGGDTVGEVARGGFPEPFPWASDRAVLAALPEPCPLQVQRPFPRRAFANARKAFPRCDRASFSAGDNSAAVRPAGSPSSTKIGS